ncbi:MAG TPA: hypothetical protein VGE41_10260 [Verrucomicrobiae bacterium]|jgi:hypothetical protein
MKTIRTIAIAGLLGALTLLASGCKTAHVCKNDQDAGFAFIQCQPVDISVYVGKPAKFKVNACGKEDIAYQWYFNHTEIDTASKDFDGAQTPILTVNSVDASKLGFYWCELQSTDSIWGSPSRTRTRSASLGMIAVQPPAKEQSKKEKKLLLPSGGAMLNSTNLGGTITEQNPMPSPSTGTNYCGNHCGWLNFNNSGLGYTPTGTTANFTVRVGGVVLPNTSYNLLWRYSSTNLGCAAPLGTTQRTAPALITKRYVYTVYFITGQCPPTGSTVTLQVDYF